MALPIIAAGVLARVGAKKLAKKLLKKKKPQNTRKNPDYNLGPSGKGGNMLDKKNTRQFINKENKEIAKLKKVKSKKAFVQGEVESRIMQSRQNIENVMSNYSSKSRKTLLKHSKR